MPSEKKTPNIGLNQWQGNEYPKRQDFVDDNLKIDTEIKKLNDVIEDLNAENITLPDGKTISEKFEEIETEIGNIEELDTDTKSNIIAAINEIYQEIVAHKAETTQQAHLAKNIGVEDANNNFVATDVEGALNELFQSGVESNQILVEALNSKEVEASTNDTINTNVNKVNLIEVGDYKSGEKVSIFDMQWDFMTSKYSTNYYAAQTFINCYLIEENELGELVVTVSERPTSDTNLYLKILVFNLNKPPEEQLILQYSVSTGKKAVVQDMYKTDDGLIYALINEDTSLSRATRLYVFNEDFQFQRKSNVLGFGVEKIFYAKEYNRILLAGVKGEFSVCDLDGNLIYTKAPDTNGDGMEVLYGNIIKMGLKTGSPQNYKDIEYDLITGEELSSNVSSTAIEGVSTSYNRIGIADNGDILCTTNSGSYRRSGFYGNNIWSKPNEFIKNVFDRHISISLSRIYDYDGNKIYEMRSSLSQSIGNKVTDYFVDINPYGREYSITPLKFKLK